MQDISDEIGQYYLVETCFIFVSYLFESIIYFCLPFFQLASRMHEDTSRFMTIDDHVQHCFWYCV